MVLHAKQAFGEKTQSHEHYVKGSVFCGQCGSRLIVTMARSRRGVIYPYLICAGRHSKCTNCEQKSMFIPDVERAVEDHYRRVQIPEHVLAALRDLITAEFDRLSATSKQERQAYQHERDDLLDERVKLLQAHLDDCLALAKDCHAIYTSIDDSLRRVANQAFFDKLYVTEADTVDGEPGGPFNIMFNPEVQATALRRQTEGDLSRTRTGDVGGSNNDDLVGPAVSGFRTSFRPVRGVSEIMHQ
ncbi:zinc ribbon domain-containing protein [Nesterenkonia lacusekhoensis]|uniref:Recombinase zinc beta ribbon domain-containing protein n=1 Tax=Nesterenkonia lacusekhoensis TaxID=150832 RepID=A0ABS4T1E0_9MICC|nr:zinc ribbon domain-containing protein [Nesterenkonia lacusekhoensis]MBP2317678.1 hypothetical protein [Nesterenkonia lacusekhoensis]